MANGINQAKIVSMMLSVRRIVGKRVSAATVREAVAADRDVTAERIALSILGR